MEGVASDYTERDRESPHDGDASASEQRTTGYPVAPARELLLQQRDVLVREVRALEAKVAGIDMALAILNDAAPITGE